MMNTILLTDKDIHIVWLWSQRLEQEMNLSSNLDHPRLQNSGVETLN